jgi:16S rRNA (guanine(966)-N(2))-methyltransferase RsmD
VSVRIIAGSARGKKLLTPPGGFTRPALARLRESLFSRIADEIEGCIVLDLFAGVGAFGLEALSRGARHATFVERSPQALYILRQNVEKLSFHRQATILCGDALLIPEVEGSVQTYGLIFMDPPFLMFHDEGAAEKVLQRATSLLSSRATADSTLLFLRIPSAFAPPSWIPSSSVRDYGQSRVLVLQRSRIAKTPAAPPR